MWSTLYTAVLPYHLLRTSSEKTHTSLTKHMPHLEFLEVYTCFPRGNRLRLASASARVEGFECMTRAFQRLDFVWPAVQALRNTVHTYIHTDPSDPVVGDSIEHINHPGIHAEVSSKQVIIAQLLAVTLSKQNSCNWNNVFRLSIAKVDAAHMLSFLLALPLPYVGQFTV